MDQKWEPRRPTRAEAAWMKRLEAVLKDAPPTVELLTIGDSFLNVLDKSRAKDSDLHDGKAHDNGVVIGYVDSACKIHGVSG